MIAGPPSEIGRALLIGGAWVINVAVAEWAISKRPAPPARWQLPLFLKCNEANLKEAA